MAATKHDLRLWFDEGQRLGAAYMIVVCDTFDWEDYPAYCLASGFAEKYRHYVCANMQKIMEVYNLSTDREKQMSERRAWHCPAGFEKITKK
jgi:hypothetical protein